MTLFDKLQPTADRLAAIGIGAVPFDTVIEHMFGPTEVIIGGPPHADVRLQQLLRSELPSRRPRRRARSARCRRRRHHRIARGQRHLRPPPPARADLRRRCYGMRHAQIFTTGYQANVGLISGLCGADDVVLLDMESHASIYDGARLSGANIFAFRHNSPADLQRKLSRLPDPGRCLVVIEGLVLDQRRRRAGGGNRRLVPAVRRLPDGRRSPFVRPLRRRAASAAPKPRACSIGSISSSARFRRRWPAIGGFCVSNHAELTAAALRRAPLRLHRVVIAGQRRRRRGGAAGAAARYLASAAAVGERAARPRRPEGCRLRNRPGRIADRAGPVSAPRSAPSSSGACCSIAAST